MRPAHLFSLLAAPFFAACGTVHDWNEMQTGPMTFGECYDGMIYLVQNDGFTVDAANSDRGMGTLQSRWRFRQLGLNRPGRYRLVAEVDLDRGSAKDGWPVRFAIMQEKVKDLGRSMEPRESDWSKDGQDREREGIFAERFVRRLGPKVPATTPAADDPGATRR